MKKISVKFITRCAAIAALYTVISLALLPVSYGIVNFRISEALTLLPVITPVGVFGVTVGCLLTNAAGVALGANILGAADILFGTLATLIAALLSRSLRNIRFKGIPAASAIPPVILNAVIIGAEHTFAETGALLHPLWLLNMFYVGLGQTVACFALGLPMLWALEKTGLSKKLFD
jgi:uncharacterized membrane protein